MILLSVTWSDLSPCRILLQKFMKPSDQSWVHIARLISGFWNGSSSSSILFASNDFFSPSMRLQGDAEALNKYCSKEVIERCTAERAALKGHGLFFDHKVKSFFFWLNFGSHTHEKAMASFFFLGSDSAYIGRTSWRDQDDGNHPHNYRQGKWSFHYSLTWLDKILHSDGFVSLIIFDDSSKRKKSSVFVTRMAKSKKEAR